ncbi:hypothetical protein HDV63DRAFT_403082 [Trichoderma sp. SZMC 28014]
MQLLCQKAQQLHQSSDEDLLLLVLVLELASAVTPTKSATPTTTAIKDPIYQVTKGTETYWPHGPGHPPPHNHQNALLVVSFETRVITDERTYEDHGPYGRHHHHRRHHGHGQPPLPVHGHKLGHVHLHSCQVM